MIRRLILAAAGLALAAGFAVLPAAAASASPVNHCHDLWANSVLHKYPHCYANETPAEKAPYPYGL
jgi:hypothetical protein